MEKFITSKKKNLVEVLKFLKEVLQINENSPINVLNYIKKLESFPNAYITFRTLLTIPVTVSGRARNLGQGGAKLKDKIGNKKINIKKLININNKISKELYDNLIVIQNLT